MDETFNGYIGDKTAVLVYFEYQPHEPATREYPGAVESVEITGVEVVSDDDLMNCLNTATLLELEEQFWTKLKAGLIQCN